MKRHITNIVVYGVLIISTFIITANFRELMIVYAQVFVANVVLIILPASIYYIFLKNHISFFEHFFHELTHMLFSVLFFEKILHFFASQTNGELATVSSFRNIITTTSPYFFPIITLLLMAICIAGGLDFFKPTIPASYGVFLAMATRQLFANQNEVRLFKIRGWIFLFVMNFWISLFIFSWYAEKFDEFINVLTTQNHEQTIF